MFSVEVGCFPNLDKFGKKLLNINIKSTRQEDQIWLHAVHGVQWFQQHAGSDQREGMGLLEYQAKPSLGDVALDGIL
jgi:hypothetical protein